jgi:hypothetical protein
LDDLAALGIEQLDDVYRAAAVPSSLKVLEGSPLGRMLTLVGPLGRGRARERIARIARSSLLPWAGKSFTVKDDAHGSGINRIRPAGEMYPFDKAAAQLCISNGLIARA